MNLIRGAALWDKAEKEARKKFRKDESFKIVALDIGHVEDNEPVHSAWCKLKNQKGEYAAGYVNLNNNVQ